jgi:hypothetical protein
LHVLHVGAPFVPQGKRAPTPEMHLRDDFGESEIL